MEVSSSAQPTPAKRQVKSKYMAGLSAIKSDATGSEAAITAATEKFLQKTKDSRQAKKATRNADAIKTLLASIKSRPRFGRMVEYSVDCLTNMCLDDAVAETMVELGAVEVLMHVVKISPFNEKIARAVNDAVAAIAATSELAELLAERGVLSHLEFSLLKHHEPATQESAVKALTKILKSAKNAAAFLNSKGLEALERAQELLKDEKKGSASTIRAMAALFDAAPDESAKFMESKLFSSVVKQMETDRDNEDIASSAVELFGNLAKSNAGNVAVLKEKGVIEQVNQVMSTHQRSKVISKAGAALLTKASGESEVLQALQVVDGTAEKKVSVGALVHRLADMKKKKEQSQQVKREELKGAHDRKKEPASLNAVPSLVQQLITKADLQNKKTAVMKKMTMKAAAGVGQAQMGSIRVQSSSHVTAMMNKRGGRGMKSSIRGTMTGRMSGASRGTMKAVDALSGQVATSGVRTVSLESIGSVSHGALQSLRSHGLKGKKQGQKIATAFETGSTARATFGNIRASVNVENSAVGVRHGALHILSSPGKKRAAVGGKTAKTSSKAAYAKTHSAQRGTVDSRSASKAAVVYLGGKTKHRGAAEEEDAQPDAAFLLKTSLDVELIEQGLSNMNRNHAFELTSIVRLLCDMFQTASKNDAIILIDALLPLMQLIEKLSEREHHAKFLVGRHALEAVIDVFNLMNRLSAELMHSESMSALLLSSSAAILNLAAHPLFHSPLTRDEIKFTIRRVLSLSDRARITGRSELKERDLRRAPDTVEDKRVYRRVTLLQGLLDQASNALDEERVKHLRSAVPIVTALSEDCLDHERCAFLVKANCVSVALDVFNRAKVMSQSHKNVDIAIPLLRDSTNLLTLMTTSPSFKTEYRNNKVRDVVKKSSQTSLALSMGELDGGSRGVRSATSKLDSSTQMNAYDLMALLKSVCRLAVKGQRIERASLMASLVPLCAAANDVIPAEDGAFINGIAVETSVEMFNFANRVSSQLGNESGLTSATDVLVRVGCSPSFESELDTDMIRTIIRKSIEMSDFEKLTGRSDLSIASLRILGHAAPTPKKLTLAQYMETLDMVKHRVAQIESLKGEEKAMAARSILPSMQFLANACVEDENLATQLAKNGAMEIGDRVCEAAEKTRDENGFQNLLLAAASLFSNATCTAAAKNIPGRVNVELMVKAYERQLDSVGRLIKMSKTQHGFDTLLFNCGAATLLDTMQFSARDKDEGKRKALMKQCLSSLCDLSVDARIAEQMYDNGGLAMMKEAMEELGDDSESIKQVLQMLSSMSTSVAHAEDIKKMGLLDKALHILETSGEDTVVAAMALDAISGVSQFLPDVGNEHLIQDQTFGVMDRYFESNDILLSCMNTLCVLSAPPKETHKVLEILRKKMDDEPLVFSSLILLEDMLLKDDLRKDLLQSDCLELIDNAAHKYRADQDIAGQGSRLKLFVNNAPKLAACLEAIRLTVASASSDGNVNVAVLTEHASTMLDMIQNDDIYAKYFVSNKAVDAAVELFNFANKASGQHPMDEAYGGLIATAASLLNVLASNHHYDSIVREESLQAVINGLVSVTREAKATGRGDITKDDLLVPPSTRQTTLLQTLQRMEDAVASQDEDSAAPFMFLIEDLKIAAKTVLNEHYAKFAIQNKCVDNMILMYNQCRNVSTCLEGIKADQLMSTLSELAVDSTLKPVDRLWVQVVSFVVNIASSTSFDSVLSQQDLCVNVAKVLQSHAPIDNKLIGRPVSSYSSELLLRTCIEAATMATASAVADPAALKAELDILEEVTKDESLCAALLSSNAVPFLLDTFNALNSQSDPALSEALNVAATIVSNVAQSASFGSVLSNEEVAEVISESRAKPAEEKASGAARVSLLGLGKEFDKSHVVAAVKQLNVVASASCELIAEEQLECVERAYPILKQLDALMEDRGLEMAVVESGGLEEALKVFNIANLASSQTCGDTSKALEASAHVIEKLSCNAVFESMLDPVEIHAVIEEAQTKSSYEKVSGKAQLQSENLRSPSGTQDGAISASTYMSDAQLLHQIEVIDTWAASSPSTVSDKAVLAVQVLTDNLVDVERCAFIKEHGAADLSKNLNNALDKVDKSDRSKAIVAPGAAILQKAVAVSAEETKAGEAKYSESVSGLCTFAKTAQGNDKDYFISSGGPALMMTLLTAQSDTVAMNKDDTRMVLGASVGMMKDNAEAMVHGGSIHAFHAVLDKYSDDATLVAAVMEGSNMLAKNEAYAEMLHQNHILEKSMSAMEQHSDNATIASGGMKLLAAASKHESISESLCATEDYSNVTMHVLDRFSENNDIVMQVMGALDTLPASANQLTELVKQLKANEKNPARLMDILNVFEDTCLNMEVAKNFDAAGAPKVLASITEKNGLDAALVEKVFRINQIADLGRTMFSAMENLRMVLAKTRNLNLDDMLPEYKVIEPLAATVAKYPISDVMARLVLKNRGLELFIDLFNRSNELRKANLKSKPLSSSFSHCCALVEKLATHADFRSSLTEDEVADIVEEHRKKYSELSLAELRGVPGTNTGKIIARNLDRLARFMREGDKSEAGMSKIVPYVAQLADISMTDEGSLSLVNLNAVDVAVDMLNMGIKKSHTELMGVAGMLVQFLASSTVFGSYLDSDTITDNLNSCIDEKRALRDQDIGRNPNSYSDVKVMNNVKALGDLAGFATDASKHGMIEEELALTREITKSSERSELFLQHNGLEQVLATFNALVPQQTEQSDHILGITTSVLKSLGTLSSFGSMYSADEILTTVDAASKNRTPLDPKSLGIVPLLETEEALLSTLDVALRNARLGVDDSGLSDARNTIESLSAAAKDDKEVAVLMNHGRFDDILELFNLLNAQSGEEEQKDRIRPLIQAARNLLQNVVAAPAFGCTMPQEEVQAAIQRAMAASDQDKANDEAMLTAAHVGLSYKYYSDQSIQEAVDRLEALCDEILDDYKKAKPELASLTELNTILGGVSVFAECARYLVDVNAFDTVLDSFNITNYLTGVLHGKADQASESIATCLESIASSSAFEPMLAKEMIHSHIREAITKKRPLKADGQAFLRPHDLGAHCPSATDKDIAASIRLVLNLCDQAQAPDVDALALVREMIEPMELVMLGAKNKDRAAKLIDDGLVDELIDCFNAINGICDAQEDPFAPPPLMFAVSKTLEYVATHAEFNSSLSPDKVQDVVREATKNPMVPLTDRALSRKATTLSDRKLLEICDKLRDAVKDESKFDVWQVKPLLQTMTELLAMDDKARFLIDHGAPAVCLAAFNAALVSGQEDVIKLTKDALLGCITHPHYESTRTPAELTWLVESALSDTLPIFKVEVGIVADSNDTINADLALARLQVFLAKIKAKNVSPEEQSYLINSMGLILNVVEFVVNDDPDKVAGFITGNGYPILLDAFNVANKMSAILGEDVDSMSKVLTSATTCLAGTVKHPSFETELDEDGLITVLEVALFKKETVRAQGRAEVTDEMLRKFHELASEAEIIAGLKQLDNYLDERYYQWSDEERALHSLIPVLELFVEISNGDAALPKLYDNGIVDRTVDFFNKLNHATVENADSETLSNALASSTVLLANLTGNRLFVSECDNEDIVQMLHDALEKPDSYKIRGRADIETKMLTTVPEVLPEDALAKLVRTMKTHSVEEEEGTDDFKTGVRKLMKLVTVALPSAQDADLGAFMISKGGADAAVALFNIAMRVTPELGDLRLENKAADLLEALLSNPAFDSSMSVEERLAIIDMMLNTSNEEKRSGMSSLSVTDFGGKESHLTDVETVQLFERIDTLLEAAEDSPVHEQLDYMAKLLPLMRLTLKETSDTERCDFFLNNGGLEAVLSAFNVVNMQSAVLEDRDLMVELLSEAAGCLINLTSTPSFDTELSTDDVNDIITQALEMSDADKLNGKSRLYEGKLRSLNQVDTYELMEENLVMVNEALDAALRGKLSERIEAIVNLDSDFDLITEACDDAEMIEVLVQKGAVLTALKAMNLAIELSRVNDTEDSIVSVEEKARDALIKLTAHSKFKSKLSPSEIEGVIYAGIQNRTGVRKAHLWRHKLNEEDEKIAILVEDTNDTALACGLEAFEDEQDLLDVLVPNLTTIARMCHNEHEVAVMVQNGGIRAALDSFNKANQFMAAFPQEVEEISPFLAAASSALLNIACSRPANASLMPAQIKMALKKSIEVPDDIKLGGKYRLRMPDIGVENDEPEPEKDPFVEKTKAALSTLANLALIPENVSIIMKNGGPNTVATAMRVAMESTRVEHTLLHNAIRVVRRVSTSKQNVKDVVDAGLIPLLCTALNEYQTDPEISAGVLEALYCLAETEEHADMLLSNDAMSRCLGAIALHRDDEAVVQNGSKLVARVGSYESVHLEAEAFKTLAETSRIAASNKNGAVVVATLEALERLNKRQENVDMLVSTGSLSSLVTILKTSTENKDITQHVLHVLKEASTTESAAESLRTNGFLEAALHSMEAHEDDLEIQQYGSDAIQPLITDAFLLQKLGEVNDGLKGLQGTSKTNKKQQLLVEIAPKMKLLAEYCQIEAKACLFAENGAIHVATGMIEESRGVDHKDVPLAAHVLNDTIASLIRLSSTPNFKDQLSRDTFSAVLQCSHNDPTNEDLAERVMWLAEEYSRFAGTEHDDGLSRDLISLSKRFPDNDHITSSLVVCLGHIALHAPESCSFIVANGGHELVLDYVHASMDNPVELENALNVVNLMSGAEEFRSSMAETGAVETVVKALKAQPDDAVIQEMALECISGFAMGSEVLTEMGHTGMVPTIIEVMQQFPEAECIQTLSVDILDSLSLVEDNALQILEMNAIDIVDMSTGRYVENVELQDNAARLMQTLAVACESQEPEIEEIPEEELMQEMSVIAEEVKHQVTRSDAIVMLDRFTVISRHGKAVENVSKAGGFEMIQKITEAHPEDVAVRLTSVHAVDDLLISAGENVNDLERMEDVIATVSSAMHSVPDVALQVDVNRVRSMISHLYRISRKRKNRRNLIKKGVLDDVFPLFHQHADDQETTLAFMMLFGLMSVERSFIKKVRRDNTIPALIRAMYKFMDVEGFQQHALLILANLSEKHDLKEIIANNNGIEVAATAMVRYERREAVIMAANMLLANMSFNSDENAGRIIKCPALEKAIAGMILFPESENLCIGGALLISNVSFGSDKVKVHVTRLGGAKALVAVALRSLDNIDLLVPVFKAIGNLAFCVKNVQTIVKEGGVQSIVAGMTMHGDNMELLSIGLTVMTNLAAEMNDESMAIIAQEGAVQAIVEVCNGHPHDSMIQLAAISCLVNLAQEQFNATMVVRQGGVVGVTDALLHAMDDSQIVHNATSLMYTLAIHPSSGSTIIKNPGTVDTLCRVLDNYPHGEVATNVLGTFSRLAYSPSTAEQLGRRGALQAIVNATELRLKEADPLYECLTTLGAVVRSEWCAVRVASATMDQLGRALRMHYRDVNMCDTSLGYIGNLCCFDSSGDIVGQTGIISVIISLMQTNQDNKGIMLRGLRALENLAYSNENNKEILKKEGALMVVDAFKRYWARDVEVTGACEAAHEAIFNRKQRDQLETLKVDIRERLQDAKRTDSRTIPEHMRNMMLSGSMLTKYSQNAKPRARHVFVSKDLKRICWRDPKKPVSTAKFLKVEWVRSVNRGRATKALNRRNAIGKIVTVPENCFAILTRDRDLSLEADTMEEAEMWAEALTILVEYRKHVKALENV